MSPAVAVRRTVTSFAGVGAVIAVLVFIVLLLIGLGVLWSLLVALVLGGGVAAGLYLTMDQAILRGVGASPAGPEVDARLANVVQGLCVANGFRAPTIHMIDDAAPNLIVVGRDTKHGELAVTSGLLDRLDRVELEGAVAHALLRLRQRTTTAEGAGAVLIRFFGFVPGLRRVVVENLFDPRASAELDVGGVQLTRYPPGLAGALDGLRRDGREPRLAPVWSRHMWLCPIDGGIGEPAFTVEDRIAVLEEL